MNQKHLTQIWLWVSIVCILYVLTNVISLQGGTDFVGRLFGDKGPANVANRPAVGYFGAIIGAGLFFVASSVLALHARRHGDYWHARIPVAWLENVNTAAWEARVFQIVVLGLFLALPALGIVRCMQEAERGEICEHDASHFYAGDSTLLLAPPTAKNRGNQMRLRGSDSKGKPCDDGIEIFPRSLTPLLFYGLPLAAAFATIVALYLVFVRKSAAVASQSADTDITG
jgi:hypothetical protein